MCFTPHEIPTPVPTARVGLKLSSSRLQQAMKFNKNKNKAPASCVQLDGVPQKSWYF